MKIFVFERIEKVSCNYHGEGGLVIIANDIEHAKSVISADAWIQPTEKEWQEAQVFELAKEETPRYWVMPDAGCC